MSTLPTGDPAALFALLDTSDVSHDEVEEAIVSLGATAVPVLVKALSDEKSGWCAARLLGRIGAPAARKAEPTLIRVMRTAKTEPGRAWPARALAQLGRLDALEPLLASKKKEDHFTLAEGLKEGRPKTYAFLEQALATGPGTFVRCVASTLSPGSARFDYSEKELAPLLAAARSQHAILRRDAICNLPNVERRARPQLVPTLVAALTDRDAHVRRLAILGLDDLGKRVVRASAEHLRPLRDDRVAAVRDTAARVLDAIGA
ncbi:MAG: HEAT repeat domain-containing protein [Myxococcota bacterium]